MAATSMRAHSHTPLQTINRGNYFMRPLRSSAPESDSDEDVLVALACHEMTKCDLRFWVHDINLKRNECREFSNIFLDLLNDKGKHKSAVELLQESKYLYVKSEIVLDQRQQLKSSSPDNVHSPFVKVRGSATPTSAQLRRSYNSSASSTDQLQAKLRKLLNADSKENLIEDAGVQEEVRRSPQQCRRSNSHKKQQQPQTCPVHHKSLPDLHAATSSGSDSSEPASCEYVLYTNTRKCSSSRQSTNDGISVESSTSRSKYLSSQRSSKSSHSGSGRHGLALASPVKSSISYGGSAGKTEYRRPEALWDSTGEADEDEGVKLRPILRSKSDVGHRYTKLTPAPPPPPTPANLDTFFEQLGLNSADFHIITRPSSQTSSPVFFSDTSSVDSTCATNQSYGGSEGATGSSGEVPSIVERNARIIKWLCNCRKAQLVLPSAIS